MNVSALSEELRCKTVERFCERFRCFADPVNGEPRLKQSGNERTGHLWVHFESVRVLAEHGIKVCQLCVCTRSLVGEHRGKQPITHTHGTFCGGKFVIKVNTWVVLRMVLRKLNVMKPNRS